MVTDYGYPIFVSLVGKRITVVGAGRVAERKIEALQQAGAHIIVIAPLATARIQEWASTERIIWHSRVYAAGDALGSQLVFAATDQDAVNAQVTLEAKSLGIWVNSATDSEQGDFIVPAVMKRGPLQIGVSTSGISPALARQIRTELEAAFGDEYVIYLTILGEIRSRLRQLLAASDQRGAVLRWFIESDLLRQIRMNGEQQARLWMEEQLLERIRQLEFN
ncbi:MAG: precorrin-2 dehydrogenase / sirohydrochlorin ferrochelatase [Bacilli bacterium]|nr:precorrin-2 dehydrogenase / sirohydrochlorin ferrochelatase [Bacilli bacterium]